MKLEDVLNKRSEHKCELCKAEGMLNLYEVPYSPDRSEDSCIMICSRCLAQLEKKEEPDTTHWNFLTGTIWSEIPAVQIVSWRMLNRFRNESWAADSLDMMYLDDEKLAWAKATGDHENDSAVDLHRDANGHILQTHSM